MDKLLKVNESEDEDDVVASPIVSKLQAELAQEAITKNAQTSDPQTRNIVPQAGFVLKTKTSTGEKVFINVCQNEQIPNARLITDEQLVEMLENLDTYSGEPFRVPMSIGEPHDVSDKRGLTAAAYDVVINPLFLTKISTNVLFRSFFIQVVIEGIENKYELQLDRASLTQLKNCRYFGEQPSEQTVRTKSKPFIVETGKQEVQSETSAVKKGSAPKFCIVQDPPEGAAEYLVAEFELPALVSAKSVQLDVGEDRIVLSTRGNQYYLDVYIPFRVEQSVCTAQFNRDTKVRFERRCSTSSFDFCEVPTFDCNFSLRVNQPCFFLFETSLLENCFLFFSNCFFIFVVQILTLTMPVQHEAA